MLRWYKYTIVLIVIVFLGLAFNYSYILNASLIGISSQFKQISNQVYVEKSLSLQQQQKVLSILHSARLRITNVYGKPQAKPTIIVTDQSDSAFKYGLFDSPGIFFFIPWAQYLVLNNDVINIDIGAHELVHAEIFHRIGFWNRLFQMPTWFDEGAAMVVDYRGKFSSDVEQFKQSEVGRVKSLDNYKQFWGQSQEMTTRNYVAARFAVDQLFHSTGFHQFYPFLDNIKNGTSFDDAIKTLRKTSKRKE